MLPLLGAEPLPVHPRALSQRIIALAAQHVHGRPREIIQSTSMVKIQVTHDNMPDVVRGVPERFNLTYRRHVFPEFGLHHRKKEPTQARRWRANVL
jgi:hypothetical protein